MGHFNSDALCALMFPFYMFPVAYEGFEFMTKVYTTQEAAVNILK